MKRALGLLALATLQLAAVPVRTHAPTGDVLGVSVVSAPGRAEVVVDIRGTVEVTDFVLQNPPRLVLDLTGARLVGPSLPYDGINRAGIRNVRYSQFRSDVVRVVIELDDARDYQVTQESSAVRVAFEAAQAFAAWPGGAVAPAASTADLPAAIAPTVPPRPRRAGDVGATVAPAPQAAQQQRISVRFDAANINDVVANFAAFSGRSIITGKDVVGTVTAEIRDQPWDVAFNAILASQGLSAVELPGGIIRVDSRANLVEQDTTEPLATRAIKINYARAGALVPSLAPILSTRPRGTVAADTTTNSLIVTDRVSRIDTIVDFVRRFLDVRTPQVAIQAKIIFVNRSDLEALGLRYDIGTRTQYFNSLIPRDTTGTRTATTTIATAAPISVVLGGNAVSAVANAASTINRASLELIYTTVLGKYAFSTFLQALQEVTLADVQAEPSVTVIDNQKANIFVGQRTPIRIVDPGSAAGGPARVTVTLLQTGIKLEVTPHVVMGTREILMELHAERSSVDVAPSADVGGIFGSQEGTTQILVRDGETAVIGGLTVTEVTVARSGIPFLMDLPVIGRLFGVNTNKETRQDLLILVTPHIVDDVSPSETTPRR
jgi:type IV pilus secretin PilQ/predicted competence protein